MAFVEYGLENSIPAGAGNFQITLIGRNNGQDACNDQAILLSYFVNTGGNDEYNLIRVGTRIYNFLGSPLAGGSLYYGIREFTTGNPTHYIQVNNEGFVIGTGRLTCRIPGEEIDTEPIVIEEPDPPVEENVPIAVTPPNSAIEYHYFTILNESYSKKIFGYYSGSASFPYLFNAEQTGSGEGNGDPTSGYIYLDKGAIGSDGTTDEDDSTKLVIDVQTSASKETIINYLSTLSSSIEPADYGSVKISSVEKPTFSITYNISEINTHPTSSTPGDAILTNGWFELDITLSASAEGSNPLSSSIAFLEQPASYDLPVNVEFYNDALLGYHEIELPGSESISFVAAIEQTGSLKSGSISAPFNTSWGISEAEFLANDYYPSSRGYGYMWNDGYKAKHIKLNNISYDGDKLSSFIRKSEESNFVLFNPKDANQKKLYTADGNYSELYVLDNVTKYTDYSHLKVDQLNILTSFAVDSENFASNNFNLNASGNWIIYATSSGTITHPTASTGIDKSIPQGYFPRTLATEQYFRGWDDSVYYFNGELVRERSFSYVDELGGFNTGSTEQDNDDSPNYKKSSLPFFIDATSSFVTIQSESIVEFNNQSNLVKIGPSFKTAGDSSNQQTYYYKEDTGEVVIQGSEHIDTKKSPNLIYNTLYDVELVPPGNNTVVYTTPEGFAVTVEASQSLWLSRGIANPGTQDGDLWKYNRFLHRPYKAYVLTSTGSYIKGYSEELYGEIVYREGPYPVGPPANEFERIFIAYSSSEASNREDGVYTFLTDLDENVTLYASADLDYKRNGDLLRARYGEAQYNSEEYGQEDTGSLLTWETASLKVYKNNSVLVKDTFYNVSASIVDGITLDVTKSISSGGFRTGDKIKVSVEVENAQPGFNAAIVVNNYNLQLDAPTPPTSDLVPVTFDNALGLTDDCNPTINNVVGDRPNERLQDVDYSIDINHPINFDQILKDEAVRATVPESNFTQLGFANQRYFGSSTSRRQVNEFNIEDEVDFNNKQFYASDKSANLINKGKGPKLGKEPNVELKNGYIAYFNKLIDPYPLVNGKTAYYVKYLIDEEGTVFDPTLSDINFSILENTFQLQDYDQQSTRAKVSLQNIDQVKELSKLNEGISSTFKVGEYPVPILYSQTSSLGHTNNIILSGSPFFGTLSLGRDWTNFGINVNSTQTQFQLNSSLGGDARKESLDISTTNLEFPSSDLTPFENNEVIPTSSFEDEFKIDFPQDANAEIANTDGAALSDNFVINGSVEFFSSTTPAKYRGRQATRVQGAESYYPGGSPYSDGRNPFTVNIKPYRNGSVNTTNFKVKSLQLEIITSPGTNNEYVYNRLDIGNSSGYAQGYNYQWRKTSSGVAITPHSIYLEKRILGDLLNGDWRDGTHRLENAHLVGGGYTPKSGDSSNHIQGINAVAVVYKWIVNFEFTNIKQADDFYLSIDGDWDFAFSNSSYARLLASKKPKDWFHHVNGRHNWRHRDGVNNVGDYAWVGTFNPDVAVHNTDVTSFNTKPVLKYEVTSPLSSNDQNANGAPGPFWRRVPNTTDMLYMSSSILNQAYGTFDEEGNNTNGKYYVQAKLNYKGDTNVIFPNTTEPDFIEFDPVQDPWSLQIGDEIRFENKENLTYTITSLNGRQAVIPPSNPEGNAVSDKLQIVVSPPFEFTGSDGSIDIVEPSNFDFFVVRRYKENRNFIILDQQTPYGFPTTGSLEPASSPGILLPEHRIEKYDRNPDEVLKDLIEKRII